MTTMIVCLHPNCILPFCIDSPNIAATRESRTVSI